MPVKPSLDPAFLKSLKGRRGWRTLRHHFREELAECLGTFILILIGIGSVCQTVLSEGSSGSPLAIRMGFFMAVVLAVFAAGSQSGAHINPAVTIALAVHKRFPWSKVPSYIAAQFIGAFFGALVVYGNYINAITNADGGERTTADWDVSKEVHDRATAGLFATFPAPYMDTVGAFFSEFLGTMVLVMGLMTITEARNPMAPKTYTPVAVGMVVLAIGVALGTETSFAINPARDLGPRIALAMVGYGSAVFVNFSYYFWVPIVAPILGAIFGGCLVRAFCDWGIDDSVV
ncbi:hypothetical protein GGF31_007794 [Allomyces arbusculus]|nr:hypothetical protein GGF31_007794 [Allomyces arbusculus]